MLSFLFARIRYTRLPKQVAFSEIVIRSAVNAGKFYVCAAQDESQRFDNFGALESRGNLGISLAYLLSHCVTKQDSLPVFNTP